MSKKLRILMIAAHPDDNDFRCGGLALKYVAAGHDVRFLSVCDGSGGHHTMSSAEIRERRKGETKASILAKIDRYPISWGLKQKLREEVNLCFTYTTTTA